MRCSGHPPSPSAHIAIATLNIPLSCCLATCIACSTDTPCTIYNQSDWVATNCNQPASVNIATGELQEILLTGPYALSLAPASSGVSSKSLFIQMFLLSLYLFFFVAPPACCLSNLPSLASPLYLFCSSCDGL